MHQTKVTGLFWGYKEENIQISVFKWREEQSELVRKIILKYRYLKNLLKCGNNVESHTLLIHYFFYSLYSFLCELIRFFSLPAVLVSVDLSSLCFPTVFLVYWFSFILLIIFHFHLSFLFVFLAVQDVSPVLYSICHIVKEVSPWMYSEGWMTEWMKSMRYRIIYFLQNSESVCFYVYVQMQRENDKEHKVRLAIGNGVRAEIWREFVSRFGNIQIKEFYASTEGNVGFVNYAGKIGAVGRVNFLHRVRVWSKQHFCFCFCFVFCFFFANIFIELLRHNTPVDSKKMCGSLTGTLRAFNRISR